MSLRWLKKIARAILNLLPAFVLSFVFFSSNSFALQHEYLGIPYGSSEVPSPSYDSSSNSKYLDWSNTTEHTSDGSGLVLEFEGDSYNSSYSSLNPRYSSSYLSLSYRSDYNNSCIYGSLNPIFNFGSNDRFYTTIGNPFSSIYSSSALSSSRVCSQLDNHLARFEESTLPGGILSCSRDNGAVCPGLWNTNEYIKDQVLPYSYSSSGFYLKSKAIDSEGVHYSNTFSFSDMLNNNIPSFSYLSIPLHDTDGYFLDSSNLFSGRPMEVSGSFEFDGSFAWHSNIGNNGSFFRVAFQAMPLVGSSTSWVDKYYDCSTNLITLSNLTRLDFTCPFSLESSFVMISGLRLEISGNDNYVWLTDAPWRFAINLITDNDSSPGRSFNSKLTGGGSIPGDASNLAASSSNTDWFSSLKHLFTFNFFNPFASIFTLFSDSSTCAQIPTIASMIHSNETQVCPFFDSTTRQIVTPIVAFSSIMLLFGFVVRWLGGSSGNFFDDATNQTLAHGTVYDASEDRTRSGWWRVQYRGGNRRINK